MYRTIFVDDEPWALKGLTEIIPWESLDFLICDRCKGAAEALRAIELYDPDVVFTDWRMPGMTGIDLISAIKARKPETECVIISAYSDFETARKAISYHAAGYLLKPLDKNETMELALALKLRLGEKKERRNFINLENEKTILYTVQHLKSLSNHSYCCLILSAKPLEADALSSGDLIALTVAGSRVHVYFYAAAEKNLPIAMESAARSRWHDDYGKLREMIKEASAAGAGSFCYANHPLVSSIQFFIAENFNALPSLKDLAEKFYISESYLCELFKKQAKIPVMAFAKNVRLHNARLLLGRTDLTLQEVAEQAGFNDYSYFARSFKQLFGHTPASVRRACEEGKVSTEPDFSLQIPP
jgi:two-component system response regulator YesN